MNARAVTARAPAVTRTATPVAPQTIAPDEPEIALWNKEVVPFARDLLFVLGVFGYLVGFANHTAKMAQFAWKRNCRIDPSRVSSPGPPKRFTTAG